MAARPVPAAVPIPVVRPAEGVAVDRATLARPNRAADSPSRAADSPRRGAAHTAVARPAAGER